jgi:hypothetical protein
MKAAAQSAEYADIVNVRKLKEHQDTKKPASCGLFCVLMLITTFPKIRYLFQTNEAETSAETRAVFTCHP